MKLFSSSKDRDLELLSAYLDDQLSPAERASLERRLKTDSELRSTLDGLRHVKTRLARLPTVKPPRNFTLTPKMVGEQGRLRSQTSSLMPALNWATALAAVLFAALLVTDLSGGLRLTSAQPVAAPEVAANQEAPTEGQQDAAVTTQKSLTATPEEALSLMAPVAPPSTEPLPGAEEPGVGGGGPMPPSGEPLTGGGEMGGGGGGDVSGTPEVSGYAAESLTATPPADESQRIRDGSADATEQPATGTPAPTSTPVEAESQAQIPSPALTPLRLAQFALAIILTALVTASFIARRK